MSAQSELDAVGLALEGPVSFSRVVLGHRVWPTQAAILESLATNKRTAVKACHASSKTFLMAEATLWWITRYDDGIVITTAPTGRQVQNLVWREIRDALETTAITYPKASQTKLELSEKNYAIGMATRSDVGGGAGVRFSGFRSGHVLILCDEAPGIQRDIFDAIEGIAAGGVVHQGVFGNPTVVGGAFYDCFHSNRASWNTFTIDAFDTPNLEGVADPNADDATKMSQLMALTPDEAKVEPWPGLVSREWMRDRASEWLVNLDEEESPRWVARARGRFPRKDPYQLIYVDWLEAARDRVPVRSGKKLTAGVDVAGEGESETVCYIMDGGNVVDFAAWSHANPEQPCLDFLDKYRRQLSTVNVDDIGIGHGFAKFLKRNKLPVRGINVGKPSSRKRFANFKAQAYFDLREDFKEGRIAGLTDETTIAQLSAIRHQETDKGKTAIESKERMRLRNAKSPDRAEALMLARVRVGTGGLRLPSDDLRTSGARP